MTLHLPGIKRFLMAMVLLCPVQHADAEQVEVHHPESRQKVVLRIHSMEVRTGEQGYLEKLEPQVSGDAVIVKQPDFTGMGLEEAWAQYHEAEFEKALTLFRESADTSDPSRRNESLLGLAYSHLQLKQNQEALDILKQLYQEEFRTEEVHKTLVATLFSLARWEEALTLIYEQYPSLRQEDGRPVRQTLHQIYPENHNLTALLAWSALKDEDFQEAEQFFAELVRNFPEKEDFLMSYVFTLGKGGKYDQAMKLLEEMAEPRSEIFTQQLGNLYTYFIQKALEQGRAEDAHTVMRRAEKHHAATSGLLAIYAWGCFEREDYQCAVDEFSLLHGQFPDDQEFLMGLAYSLQAQRQTLDAIELLEQVPGKLDEKGRELLVVLYGEAAVGLMDTKKYRQASKYLDKGLALDPGSRDLRSAAAWNCYHLEDFSCSEKRFSALVAEFPQEVGFLDGLALSLHHQAKNGEAIELLEKQGDKVSDQSRNLLQDLYKTEGVNAYQAGEYGTAETMLEKAFAAGVKDEKLVLLYHWAGHHNGHSDGLLKYLEDSFAEQGDPESAQSLIGLYQSLGKDRELDRLYSQMAESPNEAVRKLAADHYYLKIGSVTAAQVYNGPETCYQGCAEPRVAATASRRAKDGDDGTSRLDVSGTSLSGSGSAGRSSGWRISVHQLQVSHGSSRLGQYGGQFYRTLDDGSIDVRSIEDTYSVRMLELSWHHEGEVDFDVTVGSTPLDGPISAAPVYSVLASGDQWKTGIARMPVRESMLSWIGREDQYSDLSWGRVLKTEITAQHSWSLANPYWLSLDAQYGRYDGKNVISNQSLFTSASVGRTDTLGDLTGSTGLFFKVGGYEHNSDFHTFGHGGYFSPSLNVVVGPFVSLMTSDCDQYYFNTHLSVGYSYQETEDALRYPVSDRNMSLSEAALEDLQGSYRGESSSGVNGSLKVEGIVKLGENWQLGGFTGLESSEEYFEYNGLIYLGYSFGRNNFCRRQDLAQNHLKK